MVKRLLAILLVIAVALAGGAYVFFRNAYVVPVIMYHSIDRNDSQTKLSVSPEGFARQMEFLKKHKYNVVGLDKIVSYIEKKEPIPPRTIAITFDDGFYNNYRIAYPILKEYNLPATIFVIVKMVGQPGYCNWDEIKEMSDSGIITIGSHTVSHLWLPSMGTKQLKEELERSKAIIEENIGRRVFALCYPMGARDERVEAAAKSAGYDCAVATNPGRFKSANDVFAIKRVRISRTSDNLLTFWIETSGYYTWIKERRDD